MRLELDRPVNCTDGPFGRLADVVIDPTRRHVTHLVVEPHRHNGPARLVPVELAQAEDASDAIALRASAADVRRLPPVEDFAYLRLGEFPVDDPKWDVGIQNVLAQPYYGYYGDASSLGLGGSPMGFDSHVAIWYDRIPKGEVEVRRKSDVISADQHWLGHVDGLLVDSDDRITHVVLERGHLFGKRDATIPIGAVARVATDSVTLALTKDEVGRLPAVRVHRWTARRTDSDGRAQAKPA